MFRYLILIVAIWLGILIIRQFIRRSRIQTQAKVDTVEKMVQCVHCGVHLPEKQAIQDGSHYYCCEEHRKQARL